MIDGPEQTPMVTIDRKAFSVSAWIVVVLFAVMTVLVGAGVWVARDSPVAAPTADGFAAPADPARLRPATIEGAWDMAQDRANDWDADAALFSVSSQSDFPTGDGEDPDVPVGGWVIYVFVRGKGDETESLTMMVERNRAAIVRETVNLLGTAAPSLATEALLASPVDSAAALALAEAAAGADFRSACYRMRHVSRITYQQGAESGTGVWMVTYNDARVTNGAALRIGVDAVTGATTVKMFGGSIPPLAELPACDE